jgi:cobalt-zinc-cadmium efflux system membrane fusion protein
MKNILFIIAPAIVLLACSQPEEELSTEVETEEVAIEDSLSQPTNSSTIKCTGEISVPAEAKVSIHSPIKGILTSIQALEGEKVIKGQLLGTLEHVEIIKIQEDYLKTKAQYAFWKNEYDRKSELYNKEVIPKKEFQEVEASYLSEKAMYESLAKQIELLGLSLSNLNQGNIKRSISIKSPISGYVTNVLGNKGMFVSQDTKIFELVDDSHKHVHLNVFASDIGKVAVGQTIHYQVAGSYEQHSAKVHLVGKSVDPVNQAIHVHGHLDEENDALIIGTTVFGEIIVDDDAMID